MAGFYGKLPAKGDFLSRNLPRDFVDAWDVWLQAGMNDSRQVLGDGWLQTYLTSPLWRFVLPAGCCGAAAYAGVLMPSMDKVGRYFPIAVVTALQESTSPLMVVATCNSWFESIEDKLLAALDDPDLSIDQFDESLQSVVLNEPTLPQPFIANGLETGLRLPLSDSVDVASTFLEMSASTVSAAIEPCSFWWGQGSELVAPCLVCAPALPETGRFTAFLDGNWSMHGWTVHGDSISGITPTVIDVASL